MWANNFWHHHEKKCENLNVYKAEKFCDKEASVYHWKQVYL